MTKYYKIIVLEDIKTGLFGAISKNENGEITARVNCIYKTWERAVKALK